MAKNVTINNVTYQNVPSVNIPLQGGGGNATFWETSDADAAANHIISGKKAYGANGPITGTATVPSISQDSSSHVLSIS